ncbi:Serine/threonine-protein kinase pkn1 [Candidatus Rubidus massiliensis]|nr:MAG: serine/threonine protein kinase [Chlamydia sp. 32-24]CDZ81302.1 Serine/threonine-protein kinase pkn1 [Candidatus Rubidus massiliensis]
MEGKELGDYCIIKQIGQGSLGNVFLAEHRFMKKQFVLKVLPDELSNDRSFIQRFEEDVTLLSSIEHPNIVKIRNVSFDQGRFFLVTDCVVDEFGETTNLGQYFLEKEKKLDEEEIFHILRQLADGLDYAHSKKFGTKGIAHRGIKLNNILMGKKNALGIRDVYLSDYGLSKIVGMNAVLTRTYKYVADAVGVDLNFACGKNRIESYTALPNDKQKISHLHASFLQNFIFLSPEQKKVDFLLTHGCSADIYAFGILAYYLLMGEFPEGYFPMPSENSAWKKNWNLLIQKCLANNPLNRPEQLIPILDQISENISIPNQIGIEIMNVSQQELTTPSFQQEPEHARTLAESLPGLQRVVNPSDVQGKVLRPVLQMTHLERPRNDADPSLLFQVDSTVKQYQPEKKEQKNIQPLLTDMVVIRGGSFERGSYDGNRDEMPRHQINLPSFAIDTHPVTNEQFVRFLEAMGGEKDSNHNDIIRMRDSRIKRSGGKLSIESGYAKHPVVGVTWYGAVAYAKWIGKRLPTEAEWEIAACGGDQHCLYPTGDDIEKTQANFFSSDTTAVMSYAPNSFGLYDMAGNVYEWCHDWYGYNYYEISVQEPENPKGPLQGVYRVLRGGCWKSLKEDLRCSRRHRNNPGTVNGTYGFRCATDVQAI